MIRSRMLPRQLILPPHPPAKLTPSLSYSCSLLCASPKVNSHQINSLQPLLQNTGGYLSTALSVALLRKNALQQVLCLPRLRTPCRVSPYLATHTQTPGMGVSRLPPTSASVLATSILFALCFHILTNCVSRNPFLFTTIRIAPGWGGLPVLCAPTS